MPVVRSDYGTFLASGLSAEGIGTTIATGGRRLNCLLWYSGSADGPTAGGSAVFALQHSYNGSLGWTDIATLTAVKGTHATAQYAAGPYSYLRVNLVEVYSAAQTGTGSLYAYIQFGPLT